jgi:hypothetical protein
MSSSVPYFLPAPVIPVAMSWENMLNGTIMSTPFNLRYDLWSLNNITSMASFSNRINISTVCGYTTWKETLIEGRQYIKTGDICEVQCEVSSWYQELLMWTGDCFHWVLKGHKPRTR